MAEKVVIASLSIDVDNVIKESVRLKKEIDSLKEAQKGLDRSTATGAAAFEKNEAQLKNLTKSYRDNQTVVAALDAANKDLEKTMSTQNKSTQELRDSRSQLIKISNSIKGDTEEEIALREKLNTAIDAQTEKLREQSSDFNTSKDRIGEYKDSIKEAISEMGNLTKSVLKFLATPLGIFVALIAGAFLLIKNAMNRNEESTNKLKSAFAGFSGIVKALLGFLEPLGKFLIDGLVKGFELVEKGISKALNAIQKGLRFLGLDAAADALGNFTEKVEAAAKASREITKAELELQKAQRESRKIQLDYQKAAEKLRQIRDDETKSFEERIAANEKLGATLKKQAQDEEAIARKAIDLANMRIALEGENTTLLDERAAALTELADIQERITGQESEQIVNRVSLYREQAQQLEEIARESARVALDIAKEIREEEKALAKEIADENEAEILAEIEKEQERQLVDSENRLALLEAQGASEFELQQKFLKDKQDAEIAAAKKTGADVLLINKKYIALQKQLEAELTAFKQEQRSIILSGLVSLFGESSRIGKAFAVAQIANDTAINAAKAFGQAAVFASNPLTAGLAVNSVIQGGIIIALGAAQIAKTTGLKLAGGGIVTGAGSGKSDSIPAMLSNGESVNNANSTRMFAPIYSYLNQLGGGDRFAGGGIAGSSAAISASIIDYDLLAEKLSNSVASLPAPKVSVTEINEVGRNLSVIENMAST